MTRLTIAVDGPASSGKGTVARAVARRYDYQYVDTGAMYRAVALVARERGIDWTDEARLVPMTESLAFSFTWSGDVLEIAVNGRDVSTAIRTGVMGIGASAVSKLPGVRTALLGLQRSMGAEGGVVMDGRDIGTVVLPDADLKIYLDADVQERGRRRHAELVQRGEQTALDEVVSDVAARDKQDMEREVAPLKQADDAHYVDTTDLEIPAAIEHVVRLVEDTLGRSSR